MPVYIIERNMKPESPEQLAEAPAWLARRQQRGIPAVASEAPAGS